MTWTWTQALTALAAATHTRSLVWKFFSVSEEDTKLTICNTLKLKKTPKKRILNSYKENQNRQKSNKITISASLILI